MARNYYSQRPTQNFRSIKTKEENQKKKGGFSSIYIFSFFLCAIILGGIYFLKATESFCFLDVLDTLKTIFESDFREEINMTVSSKVLSAENFSQKTKERTPAKPSFSPYLLSSYPANPLNCGYLSSPFGKRENPFKGKEEIHRGIDIAAPFGSEVFSSFHGKVKSCGKNNADGNFILISNSPKVETLYCHLSEVLVSEGQTVKRGEVIGKVGSTGISTGSHLHFEIIIDGKSYDPTFAF